MFFLGGSVLHSTSQSSKETCNRTATTTKYEQENPVVTIPPNKKQNQASAKRQTKAKTNQTNKAFKLCQVRQLRSSSPDWASQHIAGLEPCRHNMSPRPSCTKSMTLSTNATSKTQSWHCMLAPKWHQSSKTQSFRMSLPKILASVPPPAPCVLANDWSP